MGSSPGWACLGAPGTLRMGQPSRQPRLELQMVVRYWPHHLSRRLVEIKALRPGNRPDRRQALPDSKAWCNLVPLREMLGRGAWAGEDEE